MSGFKTIKPEEFNFNPFTMINNDWMLIAAEHDGKLNAMTASWGGVGIIWGKPSAFIFVRESRYTKTLIDPSDKYTLTFFEHEPNAKMLAYMGSASGRDEDKIAKSGLTVERCGGAPYFAEGYCAMICKKMNRQPLTADNFIDPNIDPRFYADKDYHTLYVGEIETILVKE